MHTEKKETYIRTTVYIKRSLYESAKIMCILTRTKFSTLMTQALLSKIKEIKEQPLGKDDG